MALKDTSPADAYYGEDAPSEEIDLSFLDEKSDKKEN
jgi:hypothetical protein